jgi:hypothetical protein
MLESQILNSLRRNIKLPVQTLEIPCAGRVGDVRACVQTTDIWARIEGGTH